MDTETWRRDLERRREQRDEFFAAHDQSPLPPADREEFEGLPYFEPDPDLRFELPLHEHDERAPLTVATTQDADREYLRWGEFRFEIGGEAYALQAYKGERDDPRLWVPFRDATTGEETYGGGRYLDLDPDEHRTDDGWVLDFNEAYNPFCVYSDRYECPLVPGENWLEVRIEAGEKRPALTGEKADH